MALTSNQLDPIIQKATGRPATDYEVSQFSNASPQLLASLPEYYSGLNKNSSITDYLKYTGQDSSEQNRIALGSKYGITNIGTAEGNTALLNALKSGKAPVTAPVSGSITSSSTPQSTTTPQTTTSEQTTTPQGNSVGGSVSTAATPTDTSDISNPTAIPTSPVPQTLPTSDGTIDTDPDVYTALYAYKYYQNQVAKIDQQVSDLRQSQQNLYDDRIKEITETGGTPIESQVRADVSEQNRELQEQINGLLDQRTPLATNQSQASTALTQSRSDYYKNATLGISQKKLSDTELKANQAIGKSILASIQNGSSTFTNDQLSQLETSLGLPTGYLTNAQKKQATTPAPTTTTTTAPVTILGIPTPITSTKTSTKTATGSSGDPLNYQ